MTLDHQTDSESTLGRSSKNISRDAPNSESPSWQTSQDSQHSFEPIRSDTTSNLDHSSAIEDLTNDSTARTISRRQTYASGHEGEDWAEIERLISRMFGEERKSNSEEEKTRHTGVVWKGLTVKGVGLGAALQPTNGDIFLGLPRLIKRLLTQGRKGTGAGKPSIRTILDDFSVRITGVCDTPR